MTSASITQSILASVCELIAERLDDSDEDPVEFLEQYDIAIAQAKDLEKVWPKLVLWVLMDPEFGIVKYVDSNSKEYPAIALVTSLYQHLINNTPVELPQWSDALKMCELYPEAFLLSNSITVNVLMAVSKAVELMLPLPDTSLAGDVLFCQSQCLSLTKMSLEKVALAQKDKFLELIVGLTTQ